MTEVGFRLRLILASMALGAILGIVIFNLGWC